MSVASVLRVASIVLTTVVVVSFFLFAWEEVDTASKNQAAITAPGAVPIPIERDRSGRLTTIERAKIRKQIDKVADTLTSPGEEIGQQVGRGNAWVTRGGAFLFGILLFGVALRLFAGWIAWPDKPATPVGGVNDDEEEFTAGYR